MRQPTSKQQQAPQQQALQQAPQQQALQQQAPQPIVSRWLHQQESRPLADEDAYGDQALDGLISLLRESESMEKSSTRSKQKLHRARHLFRAPGALSIAPVLVSGKTPV